ncbi:MAG: sodium:calcium antiporter [Candidatus Melainabacteria bacterium]|nr:sodium:calcium antiporter [Candidatus Melainabacteria bacterium]
MPTIPLPDILLILGILAAIVGACTLFTNAIEWVGHRCNLSAGVVGSVLAAVGTALPETIVPIVAIVSGNLNPNAMSVESAGEIGTGAILGAPFMLGTLAMFITGLAVLIFTWLKKRTLHMPLDHEQFYRDMTYFFVAYGIAACSALIPASASGFRYGIAVLLLGIYGLYLYKTLTDTTEENTVVDPAHPEENEDHHLDPLYFAPKSAEPKTAMMVLQTFVGLALIVLLAHHFVGEINHLATSLKLDAMVLSLIIIPIATELPEKFNSVMWISQRKDTLAMGNLTGAMVFQSCIPTAIGVAFTPWVFTALAQTSVLYCLLSALVITAIGFRLGAKATPFVLLSGGVFYGMFVWKVLQSLPK